MNSNQLALLLGLAFAISLGALHFKRLAHKEIETPDVSLEKLERQKIFQTWVHENNKQYTHAELPLRQKTWNHNWDIVQEHNSQNFSWTLGMNKFADLSSEEFGALYTGYNAAGRETELEQDVLTPELPEALGAETVDWRTTGAVNPIRDQGQCGGCYSFASAAGLEGLYYLKTNKSAVFSPQQIIDCSGTTGNQGCDGGLMTNTYAYTKTNGVEQDADYPYQASAGQCQYDATKVVFRNTGLFNVGPTYTQLKAAIKQQPTPVAVEADQSAFQLYTSGVISAKCGKNLDHAITAVGYVFTGTTTGTGSYWIVKNQWGTAWGDHGYVKIKMGPDNVCGINSQATFPTA